MPPRKDVTTLSTRDAVFHAAPRSSRKGIRRRQRRRHRRRRRREQGDDLLPLRRQTALYRSVVADMLSAVGERVTAIAEASIAPTEKLDRFIETFVRLADERPWFPTLMLREIAEGAPQLDLDTLAHIRTVFLGFGRILQEGEAAGAFRKVHPILAYTSIVGPLIMNAARERVAAQPGASICRC